MDFDAEHAYADMQALAFPRRSGTPGAEAAQRFIQARLHTLGLEPAVEPFTFSPWLLDVVVPVFALGIAGLVLAAALTYPTSPRSALIILVVAVLVSMPATRWSDWVERLLDLGPQRQSANLVASLHSPDEAAHHVVLMAHYDSKSQRLPMAVRIVAANGGIIGGGILFIACLIETFTGASGPSAMVVVAAGLVGAAGAALVGCNPSGNRSPGALDNAAGIAVMLEVARSIPRLQLRRTRVTLVATGAEEEGLAGSVRYLQAHRGELGENVLVINLDSPGASPELAVLSAFGLPPMGRAPRLVRQVCSVAEEENLPVRPVWVTAGLAADHFPAALRRIPALTVASLGPALARIHTPGDTPDGVRTLGLAHAGRLVLGLLRALDGRGDPQR